MQNAEWGLEAESTTVSIQQKIADCGLKDLKPVTGFVEDLRAVKDPHEIEAIWAVEAQRGADVIGAELTIMGFLDGEVWQDNATWKKYVDLIRRTNPDVIITLDRDDYVHDHSNVGEMVYRAAIWASVANIPDTEYPPIDHIPTVFYFETLGTNRVAPPDHYVDITQEYEQKILAFKQHASQHGDFLEKQFGVTDWFDALETTNKLRGFQCGCKYAEAFRVGQTWPNHRAYRLLPPVQFGSRRPKASHPCMPIYEWAEGRNDYDPTS